MDVNSKNLRLGQRSVYGFGSGSGSWSEGGVGVDVEHEHEHEYEVGSEVGVGVGFGFGFEESSFSSAPIEADNSSRFLLAGLALVVIIDFLSDDSLDSLLCLSLFGIVASCDVLLLSLLSLLVS